MGILQRVTDYREGQILANARRYWDDDDVIKWVRAKRIERRGDGFVFLSERGCVIHMSDQDGAAISWGDVEAWGLITDSDGGPILAIETASDAHLVRLQVGTRRMAEDVGEFVERFSDLAPEPTRDLKEGRHLGTVMTSGRVDIKREKKSLSTHTRRVVITLVGISLIVFAVLIGFIPGPWSIPLVVAGLAILAREYDWAKDLLDWFNGKRKDIASWFKARSRSAE